MSSPNQKLHQAQVKVLPEQHVLRPRQLNIVGVDPPDVISSMIGSKLPLRLPGGHHHPIAGGRMIAVVAVTGEDKTGGVSAGGEHDAQRELLPVEKS